MHAADEHLLTSLDMSGEFAHEDLRALGLAPSRETSSNYPEGSGAHNYPALPGVQREDSVTTLLNSIGQTLAPLPMGGPASGAPVDSSPQCFDGLRLLIQSHSVHKVENPDTEDREYVVSNLRVFQIEVVLVNASNELVPDVNVGLYASLLTENGMDLVRPNPTPIPSPTPSPSPSPTPTPTPSPDPQSNPGPDPNQVWPNPNEPMLTGETEVVIIGGHP